MSGHSHIPIRHFKSIDSTNNWLKSNKETWKNPFFTIYADEQTQGRGRKGRSWNSQPGKDLLFSFVLPSNNIPLPFLSLIAGFSLTKTLKSLLPKNSSEIWIKYPNDIYWKEKKLSGILSEAVDLKTSTAIIGIGLNVNSRGNELTALNAASLLEISGQEFDREGLLVQIMDEMSTFFENRTFIQDSNTLTEKFCREWIQVSHKGSACILSESGEKCGTITELTEEGKLAIQTKENKTILVDDGLSLRYQECS